MNVSAYHGTSEEIANKIIITEFIVDKNPRKLPGDLGRGIYSYVVRDEKKLEAASNALKYVESTKKSYEKYKVIKLHCDIIEDEILDFNDIENAQLFEEFREENEQIIKEEMSNLYDNGFLKRGNIDGLVIEMMIDAFELTPCVIIKDTYTWFSKVKGDYKRSNFPNGREMCIRNQEIIKKKCII